MSGTLRVIGHLRAGDPISSIVVGEGEAVEIMTGAAVPEGADCVVMVEHVTHDRANGMVTADVQRRLSPGDNIVQTGAEARKGALILPAGTRLGPHHIGAAAACGYFEVGVFARPKVAVLATGDELVELSGPVLPHQIRNSNSYSLAAQVMAAGGEPVRFPSAPDDPRAIESAITGALDCDLLLLSGGVSAGRFDFVEQVLLSMGAEFFFTGVLIQPGRPVVFGRIPHLDGHRYLFGLPGNPVSTLVTFALFARPMLDAVSGARPEPRFVTGRLAAGIELKTGLTRFLPGFLSGDVPADAEVSLVVWQGSGDLAHTARANCYVVVPPDRGSLRAGEMVSVLLG